MATSGDFNLAVDRSVGLPHAKVREAGRLGVQASFQAVDSQP